MGITSLLTPENVFAAELPATRGSESRMNYDGEIASIIVVFVLIFAVYIFHSIAVNKSESPLPEISYNKKKLDSSYFGRYKNILGNVQSLNTLWGKKMLALISVWGFVNFIYLKVVTEAFFNHGIAIIAALLISIIFAWAIFFVSAKYAHKLFYINAPDANLCVSLLEIIQKTVIPFILFSLAYMAVSRVIVFGFSKRLYSEISSRYDGAEMSAYFFIILFVPILIHYAMTIFGTYHNSKVAKTNTPRTFGAFKYKDSKSFFEMQCEYGDTSLEKQKGVVALVIKPNIHNPKDDIDGKGRYYNLIRVASEDGGFEVISTIPSGGESDLQENDAVIWVPMGFNQELSKGFDDKRSGWMGFIMVKIAPEMDMSESGQWIVLEEYS